MTRVDGPDAGLGTGRSSADMRLEEDDRRVLADVPQRMWPFADIRRRGVSHSAGL
jgi:hypothetical protein